MFNERFPTLKLAGYLLVLLVFYLLETADGMPLTLFGCRIEVLCCVTAAVALFDGPMLGAMVGFATGVFFDLGSTGIEGLYPIYFMMFGICAGLLAERFLQKIFPSMLLLTGCAVLLLGLLRLPGMLLFGKTGVVPLLYLQQLFGNTLLSAAFSPLVYLPVRHLHDRLESYYS